MYSHCPILGRTRERIGASSLDEEGDHPMGFLIERKNIKRMREKRGEKEIKRV